MIVEVDLSVDDRTASTFHDITGSIIVEVDLTVDDRTACSFHYITGIVTIEVDSLVHGISCSLLMSIPERAV